MPPSEAEKLSIVLPSVGHLQPLTGPPLLAGSLTELLGAVTG
ncbi:hypothetical protein YPPY15_3802, partial [Yersinia pestis PY-15]